MDNHFTFGLEWFAFHASDARCHFKLGRWIKYRDRAPCDHIENFSLEFIEMCWRRVRGNDGVMVGHLRVVEHALNWLDPIAPQRFLGMRGQRRIVEG